jgi:hypothetical protein
MAVLLLSEDPLYSALSGNRHLQRLHSKPKNWSIKTNSRCCDGLESSDFWAEAAMCGFAISAASEAIAVLANFFFVAMSYGFTNTRGELALSGFCVQFCTRLTV